MNSAIGVATLPGSGATCLAVSVRALYAKEELVAETTSAFVCVSLDIVPTVRTSTTSVRLEVPRSRRSRPSDSPACRHPPSLEYNYKTRRALPGGFPSIDRADQFRAVSGYIEATSDSHNWAASAKSDHLSLAHCCMQRSKMSCCIRRVGFALMQQAENGQHLAAELNCVHKGVVFFAHRNVED